MRGNNEIEAALNAKRKVGSVQSRISALKQAASLLTGRSMPLAVRDLVAQAFDEDPFARLYFVAKQRGAIGERLKDLDENDWHRAVDALLPHAAAAAKATLAALARRPFQEGLTRQSFRAPTSPATLADIRGRWLLQTTIVIGEFDADIVWIAEHAAHIATWSGATDLGWLLAGAIDAGDAKSQAVYDTLIAAAQGEHETAQMGRHVIQALLSCSRPDAWEFVERLLLSAQRQEGLRQVILESVDEAHPQAFRRMLRLILDEDLARFSSVVRAADTWFAFLWDGASAVKVEKILERVLRFLDDAEARDAALRGDQAESAYLALWSLAFDDTNASIEPAIAVRESASAEMRFVATHFLVQTLWSSSLPPLVDALTDPDLRVAARASDAFQRDLTTRVDGARLFDHLEQLIKRVPKRSQVLDPLVWPWWKRKLERPHIANAMAANAGAVAGNRLLPYIGDLEPMGRAAFIRERAGLPNRWDPDSRNAKPRTLSPEDRVVVLDLLGDSSVDVRAAAFQALSKTPPQGDEIDRLVDLLARKPGDLRSGALGRLRSLDDAALLSTAERLVTDIDAGRRLAGLELLRSAFEAKRATTTVRARLERYVAERADLSEQERAHVDAVVGERTEVATTDTALGLIDPRSLREWPRAKHRRADTESDGARNSLKSLAELVLEHQAAEVRSSSGDPKTLVHAVDWNFGPRKREDLEASDTLVPLHSVWKAWVRDRPASTRDNDGLELVRALVAPDESRTWNTDPVQAVRGLGEWSAGARFLRGLCSWCVVWDPPPGAAAFLLDGLEDALASFTAADFQEMEQRAGNDGIYYSFGGASHPQFFKLIKAADSWLTRIRWWRTLFPRATPPEASVRLYGALRAHETAGRRVAGPHVALEDFLGAYEAGAADKNEMIDLLVGRASTGRHSTPLRDVSTRKPPPPLVAHPELNEVIDLCRRRIVHIECARGDRETAASSLALDLRWTGGLDTIARAVPALGKTHFARDVGWGLSAASRQDTLSHLVVRSLPREQDTKEAFASWAREAKVTEARLIELAVYAPLWAAHVNEVLQWPGFEDGVWWVHAHTKDDRSWRLAELKDLWAAEVSERTPLAAADLTEGAVDVAWFNKAHDALGAARWKKIDAAAKYAATSAGHTRAQLFARAMTGLISRDEILARINGSRHQDSVRALGLVPLPPGEAGEKDVLERYVRLEDFRREGRKFGSQRKQSESRAMAIGLANLARTAGYADPQRLRWAMEQRAVADLAKGPAVCTRGAVTVTLAIDQEGTPTLTIAKDGKPLKALPAALKKDEEIEELKARYQELKRQRSRVREALEATMCRGDRFKASELRTLLTHPILAPALASLVFIGDDSAGYPVEGGQALRDHAGKVEVVGRNEELRIAHPHDLFARGDWSAWQRECFQTERIQPFKQIFRELYPITDAERERDSSARYAGHQVNPKQAMALLGGRGWMVRPEEGVSRTFHEHGITAWLSFQETFHTPADIEGLTLENVVFTTKGEWKPLPLTHIAPLLFSETMRDLDLVVAVAHRGGVDPEATASTVEMRATLIRETAELLSLKNVSVSGSHAHIRGTHAEYSVHLGSGGVIVLPGTAVPIVAVHSQHRGRLFLPFADDDPRTAEVLSKVLLLSRDKELRDPNILDWIRAAAGRSTAS